MHVEVEKYRAPNRWLPFLQVVGYVLLVTLVAWFFIILRDLFEAPWLEFGPYILAILVAVRIYRTRIIEYTYRLNGQLLTIERVVGRKTTVLANFPMRVVKEYTPYEKQHDQKGLVRCALRATKNKVFVRYQGKESEKRIVFAPSQELDAQIKELLNNPQPDDAPDTEQEDPSGGAQEGNQDVSRA